MTVEKLQQTVLCLMGPTAAGKTALAMKLVKDLPLDIVSVDSAMVYKSMDIGTGKPTLAEQLAAPHRLIDIRDPANPYSAADFVADARSEIDSIHAQGRIPLLVGGTMLYFSALQKGLSTLPEAEPELRQNLLEQAAAIGWPAMHAILAEIDPLAAKRIHPNDPQRIQRALEVYHLTGQSLSSLQQVQKAETPYHFVNFALAPQDRAVLHQRIAQRFDQMLEQGFIDEVAALYAREDLHADLPAMRSVGYRQAWEYLAGKINKAQLRELSIIATRQLAKRQLTWLRSWPAVEWLELEDSPKNKQAMKALQELIGNFL